MFFTSEFKVSAWGRLITLLRFPSTFREACGAISPQRHTSHRLADYGLLQAEINTCAPQGFHWPQIQRQCILLGTTWHSVSHVFVISEFRGFGPASWSTSGFALATALRISLGLRKKDPDKRHGCFDPTWWFLPDFCYGCCICTVLSLIQEHCEHLQACVVSGLTDESWHKVIERKGGNDSRGYRELDHTDQKSDRDRLCNQGVMLSTTLHQVCYYRPFTWTTASNSLNESGRIHALYIDFFSTEIRSQYFDL